MWWGRERGVRTPKDDHDGHRLAQSYLRPHHAKVRTIMIARKVEPQWASARDADRTIASEMSYVADAGAAKGQLDGDRRTTRTAGQDSSAR